MGNCQAIDAATLVIQHPSGKVENLYWPVPASDIMKMNPGHYVALLITTTICHTTTTSSSKPPPTTTTTTTTNSNKNSSSSSTTTTRNSVRVTRVKLLRPTDTLALGHVYRLISNQEVMKGLVAKKQAKMRKNGIELADSEALKEVEKSARRSQQDKSNHQVSRHGQRSRTAPNANGGSAKPRTWQPSLHSISEAGS
ncbi:hypothetical protein Cgig2_006207 [Carnegiea gigantea]|uniref:Uncharacterized protein n=1 Tax=Carnegiea gigantea TaxID=171969 RepID=A0A9Q1L1J0_9CARY|nr:hypothetical protein Cgig2_006207 [Carnegiea gigantea]